MRSAERLESFVKGYWFEVVEGVLPELYDQEVSLLLTIYNPEYEILKGGKRSKV
jgi:hypothetical protein